MRDQRWPAIGGLATSSFVLVGAGVYVVATITGPVRPAPVVTSLAKLSPALATLAVATGVGLVLVGSMAWLIRRRGIGIVAVAAGVCWFGPDWAGYVAAPLPLRAVGLAVASLTLPFLAHLALRATDSDRRPAVRVTLRALYLVTGLLAVAWLSLYVPMLDPRCLNLCDQGPLTAFGDHRAAREVAQVHAWLTIAVGIGLAGWSVARIVRSSPRARRSSAPILGPAAAVGLAWATWAAVSLQPSGVAPPTGTLAVVAFAAQAASALALAIGVAWALLVERRALIAVRGLAERLSPLPGGGSLRATLAEALGDQGLRLLFPLPSSGELVDPDGRPAAPPATESTPIAYDDRVVALIVHSRRLADGAIEEDLGAAVRLAAENEALLAAVRHEVLELRASRARIVELGDAERQRLERDLHDGAQQRLLAVLHELSVARDQARRGGQEQVAMRLARAADDADAATEALRHIARGIHQAVLTEGGLVAALESLAIEAPVPVTIEAPASVTCSTATAMAAYRVVADTVAKASRRGAKGVSARVTAAGSEILVVVEVDGLADEPDLVALEDRVGASGGRLSSASPAAGRLAIAAELPCV